MSESDGHIHDDLPDILGSIKSRSMATEEFVVPGYYFSLMESEIKLRMHTSRVTDDLHLPSGYFDDNENRILAAVDAEKLDDQEFFIHQQNEILLRGKLESSPASEIAVPAKYFVQLEEKLLNNVKVLRQGRVIRFRSKALFYMAAAACVAVAVVLFWPADMGHREESFASLLENTELDFEDMEFFAGEDAYYELYDHFNTDVYADTVVADTTKIIMNSNVNTDVESPGTTVKLDPRTGLPIKKNHNGIKPNGVDDIPTWDDITEQDLLDYLLEEGDDEMIEDL